jgi:hypothetical protein
MIAALLDLPTAGTRPELVVRIKMYLARCVTNTTISKPGGSAGSSRDNMPSGAAGAAPRQGDGKGKSKAVEKENALEDDWSLSGLFKGGGKTKEKEEEVDEPEIDWSRSTVKPKPVKGIFKGGMPQGTSHKKAYARKYQRRQDGTSMYNNDGDERNEAARDRLREKLLEKQRQKERLEKRKQQEEPSDHECFIFCFVFAFSDS